MDDTREIPAPPTVTVNGTPHPVTGGMTVSSLLAELLGGSDRPADRPTDGSDRPADRPADLPADGPGRNAAGAAVVVELNGAIIPRETFDATQLTAGDTLEIVHFVGGG